MAISIISIGSSSSGNSYIIRAGGRTILLDVGLTAKKIIGALDAEGIAPESVDAVLVTHEHVDHVKSVRAIGRKCCNAVFYASRGTIESTENFRYIPEEKLRIVTSGEEWSIGEGSSGDNADSGSGDNAESCTGIARTCDNAAEGVRIRAFRLSHDAAEPIGFSIISGGDKASVVTDTGIITDEIFSEIIDSGMLVFEANHDEDLLMYGKYPYRVKMRIKSDHGHLSNRYAGETLARLLSVRASQAKRLSIMLAHLSDHNNAPFYARHTIEGILKENGFERGDNYTMTIAPKDEKCSLVSD